MDSVLYVSGGWCKLSIEQPGPAFMLGTVTDDLGQLEQVKTWAKLSHST